MAQNLRSSTNSNKKLDTIILEPLIYSLFSAIAYKFNATLIDKTISARYM